MIYTTCKNGDLEAYDCFTQRGQGAAKVGAPALHF